MASCLDVDEDSLQRHRLIRFIESQCLARLLQEYDKEKAPKPDHSSSTLSTLEDIDSIGCALKWSCQMKESQFVQAHFEDDNYSNAIITFKFPFQHFQDVVHQELFQGDLTRSCNEAAYLNNDNINILVSSLPKKWQKQLPMQTSVLSDNEGQGCIHAFRYIDNLINASTEDGDQDGGGDRLGDEDVMLNDSNVQAHAQLQKIRLGMKHVIDGQLNDELEGSKDSQHDSWKVSVSDKYLTVDFHVRGVDKALKSNNPVLNSELKDALTRWVHLSNTHSDPPTMLKLLSTLSTKNSDSKHEEKIKEFSQRAQKMKDIESSLESLETLKSCCSMNVDSSDEETSSQEIGFVSCLHLALNRNFQVVGDVRMMIEHQRTMCENTITTLTEIIQRARLLLHHRKQSRLELEKQIFKAGSRASKRSIARVQLQIDQLENDYQVQNGNVLQQGHVLDAVKVYDMWLKETLRIVLALEKQYNIVNIPEMNLLMKSLERNHQKDQNAHRQCEENSRVKAALESVQKLGLVFDRIATKLKEYLSHLTRTQQHEARCIIGRMTSYNSLEACLAKTILTKFESWRQKIARVAEMELKQVRHRQSQNEKMLMNEKTSRNKKQVKKICRVEREQVLHPSKQKGPELDLEILNEASSENDLKPSDEETNESTAASRAQDHQAIVAENVSRIDDEEEEDDEWIAVAHAKRSKTKGLKQKQSSITTLPNTSQGKRTRRRGRNKFKSKTRTQSKTSSSSSSTTTTTLTSPEQTLINSETGTSHLTSRSTTTTKTFSNDSDIKCNTQEENSVTQKVQKVQKHSQKNQTLTELENVAEKIVNKSSESRQEANPVLSSKEEEDHVDFHAIALRAKEFTPDYLLSSQSETETSSETSDTSAGTEVSSESTFQSNKCEVSPCFAYTEPGLLQPMSMNPFFVHPHPMMVPLLCYPHYPPTAVRQGHPRISSTTTCSRSSLSGNQKANHKVKNQKSKHIHHHYRSKAQQSQASRRKPFEDETSITSHILSSITAQKHKKLMKNTNHNGSNQS